VIVEVLLAATLAVLGSAPPPGPGGPAYAGGRSGTAVRVAGPLTVDFVGGSE